MLKSRLLAVVRTAVAVAAIGTAVSAQAPANATFEAASVKPNRSTDQQISMVAEPGGRLVAVNIPLPMFIRTAYRLQDDQLVGGPAWLNSERFDIVSKADAAATVQQLPSMMQELLMDRFKLVTHHEMRELPVYDSVEHPTED